MRPRGCGCFSTLIILVLLLVICLGLGWFVGVPRIRDSVSHGIQEGIGTQISRELGVANVGSGEHTINLSTIAGQMQTQLKDAGIEDITLTGDGQFLYLSMTSRGSKAVYSGKPEVVNGKLVMTDMSTSNNVLGFFMPAGRLGDAIELGVNNYFAAQGQRIVSLAIDTTTLSVVTEPTN